MQADLYTEFVDAIMSSDLIWSCWVKHDCRTYTSIDPQKLLLVKLRLLMPNTSTPHYRKPVMRKESEAFDPLVHDHSYQFECEDPAYRWGRRKIVKVTAYPTDPLYQYLRDCEAELRDQARIITHERKFDTRLNGLRDAMEDLLNREKTGLTVQ